MKKNIFCLCMICCIVLLTTNVDAGSYIGRFMWHTNVPVGLNNNVYKTANKLILEIAALRDTFAANGLMEINGGGIITCSGTIVQVDDPTFTYVGDLNCGTINARISVYDNLNGFISVSDSFGLLGESNINIDIVEI